MYIPSFVIFITGVLIGAFLTLVISTGEFNRRIDSIMKTHFEGSSNKKKRSKDMVSNFEILMDFKNARDFAICMSKNNICCHKASCFVEIPPEKAEEECRRCWLDFLTSDEGLDLSYLEVKKEKKNGGKDLLKL